jgi:ubiquinone/menaquinone biosynthesis C-methylase UbiE
MTLDELFKALADPTRLRIARLLGAMELAVGELAQVLGQSQPRVSRHVGILCDAGLAERRREGSWVFLRQPDAGEAANLLTIAVQDLLATAESEMPDFAAQCEADRRKLAAIRAARETAAEQYFARHAGEWDELRALHTADGEVEAALIAALEKAPLGIVLDIGTGTGRIAELIADKADRVVALDKNLEMLKVARAKLQHLPASRIELVQGDFAELPFAAESFNTVLLHQVLHFAQEPSLALAEAARVTRAGGRIAIVDFASHSREELRTRHQHVRLGFSDRQMAELLKSAGFAPHAPQALGDGELIVKIWIAERRTPARTAKSPPLVTTQAKS